MEFSGILRRSYCSAKMIRSSSNLLACCSTWSKSIELETLPSTEYVNGPINSAMSCARSTDKFGIKPQT